MGPEFNNFMITRTGRKFMPASFSDADIDICDIAHALSNLCRFNGHTARFYSVAEHCLHVADLLEHMDCDRETVLAGLLHDAAEAYTGDIISPIKHLAGQLPEIATDLLFAILRKFNPSFVMREDFGQRMADVKRADLICLVSEGEALTLNSHTWTREIAKPETWLVWRLSNHGGYTPERALMHWIDKFTNLTRPDDDSDRVSEHDVMVGRMAAAMREMRNAGL